MARQSFNLPTKGRTKGNGMGGRKKPRGMSKHLQHRSKNRGGGR
jgi:hypothetical protein